MNRQKTAVNYIECSNERAYKMNLVKEATGNLDESSFRGNNGNQSVVG